MSDKLTTFPVSLSTKAIKAIRRIMLKKNIPPTYGLRVGVRGIGCSGSALTLGFDKRMEKDLSCNIAGITVLVDKKHVLYIVGKQVDYYDDNEATGFGWSNNEN